MPYEGWTVLPEQVAAAVARVLSDVQRLPSTCHWFPNIRKWFQPEAIDGLTRIRNAISKVDCTSVRRFLWVAMAETVRKTSNSRLSTFKLHVKAAHDMIESPDPIAVFTQVATRNLHRLRAETDNLQSAGRLNCGMPQSDIRIIPGDITTIGLADTTRAEPNVLFTSPPYGDNHSTITYGQHAYLPLQWIGLYDTGFADESYLRGPTAIDSMSLGGLKGGGLARAALVAIKSAAAEDTLQKLRVIRQDHANKVGAFLSDLDHALGKAVQLLANDAHVVVTVGDRTVSGMRIPTARVVQDIFVSHGGIVVAAIRRRLPRARRIPSRNRYATRMESEWIIVMRLPGIERSS